MKKSIVCSMTIALTASSLMIPRVHASECATCHNNSLPTAGEEVKTMAPLVRRADGMASNHELLSTFHENFAVSCSVSQYQSKEGRNGGSGGHMLVYIKGACLDQEKGPTKVKVCPDSDAAKFDRNAGVTLSVDKSLKNSRFVAVEGIDLMFNGAAQEGEPVTQKVIDRTVEKIKATGALNGIKLHDHYKKPEGMADDEFIARSALGTDFAISLARQSECNFVPLTKEDVETMVNKANEINEPYISGKKKNDWDGMGKNCAHFVDNLFASIGIGKAVAESGNPIRKVAKMLTLFLPIRYKGVRVPRQSVVNIAEQVSQQMPSPMEMLKDGDHKKRLKEFGSLPQRPGALIGEVAFIDQNEMFNKAGKPVAADFIKRYDRKMTKLLNDPKVATIEGNLSAFIQRVDQMDLRSYEEAVSADKRNAEDKALYDSYRGMLIRERNDAKLKIQVLRKELTSEQYIALQKK